MLLKLSQRSGLQKVEILQRSFTFPTNSNYSLIYSCPFILAPPIQQPPASQKSHLERVHEWNIDCWEQCWMLVVPYLAHKLSKSFRLPRLEQCTIQCQLACQGHKPPKKQLIWWKGISSWCSHLLTIWQATWDVNNISKQGAWKLRRCGIWVPSIRSDFSPFPFKLHLNFTYPAARISALCFSVLWTNLQRQTVTLTVFAFKNSGNSLDLTLKTWP